MIQTNQAELHFNHEAIRKDFIIFAAKRDTGNYFRSKVPDIAMQECRALAVAYDYGNTCYILYRRSEAEKRTLKQTLENYGEDNVRIEEISSEQMVQYRLAQLLFNAIPNLATGERMCHNVTGKLFYKAGQKQPVRSGKDFCMLQISITWEYFIKLEVRTFSPAYHSQPSEPQYLYDKKTCVLRRMLREDPDKTSDHFVMKAAYSGKKSNVSFLNFGGIEEYYEGKTGVFHIFLKDVHDFLSPYLTLELISLDEMEHIGKETPDSKMTKIRQRLQKIPLYLEDTVQDEQSDALVAMLRDELEQYSHISLLTTEAPPNGSGLLRIIHNKEYYQDNSEPDPYTDAPKNCIVQHVTIEDFQLSGLKEDPGVKKVIQELAIKADIYEGHISCYDWPSLNFSSVLNFVTAEKKDDTNITCYRLRIQPDGSLQYDRWAQPLISADEEKEKFSLAYENKWGKFDWQVDGLVYENIENIHVIRRTDRFALPNLEGLERILKATNDKEPLPTEPIISIIQDKLSTLSGEEKEKEKCEKILHTLSNYGTSIPRKDIRKALELKSHFGKELNQLISEKTGILIGACIKQKQKREELFGGILDIRLFCEEQEQYYFSGVYGNSLKDKLFRACRIRKVTTTGSVPQFEKYLRLLEVDFVRTNGWTVLPFPFKYLREWKKLQP